MIDIHLHWSWLLIAAVVIIGICVAYPYLRERNEGIGGAVSGAIGCAILIVAILVGLVLGGIFIW